MRFLGRPHVDDEDLYEQVVNLRGEEGSDLHDLLPEILNDYSNYSVQENTIFYSAGALEADNRKARADDLYSNYDYLTRKKVEDVRARLLAADPRGLCGFCGNIQAGTLDHWLPRRQYPQYAILSLNLVPACYRCNNKKRQRHVTKTGLRVYLHPYLDSSYDGQFLRATVATRSEALIVAFDVRFDDPSVEPWREAVTRRHFSDLELESLFIDESIRYLDEHRSVFYAYFREGGAPSVSRYVAWDAASARNYYGSNHWKPVLLSALAADSTFCNGGFAVLGPEEPIE